MIMTDRDALLCDLAETYHIYDFNDFRPSKLAIFAAGLRDDSRIRLKMAETNYMSHTAMLAKMTDTMTLIHYYFTAKQGDPAPSLVTDLMYQDRKIDKGGEYMTYSSGKAFLEAWNEEVKHG